MKAIIIVSFFVVKSMLVLLAQTPSNIYRQVSVDTTFVISQSRFSFIADSMANLAYNNLNKVEEKGAVDLELWKLENNDINKHETAQGLNSLSLFLTGVGEARWVSIFFAAKTASLFPGDTLFANNLGSILRMMNNNRLALDVFLYAKNMCNDCATILTNLGNTLFEMQDDVSAEYFFRRSLEADPDYLPAYEGLVNVYLKRKNLKKVLEYMFKSVRGMYGSSIKKPKSGEKPSHPDPNYDENDSFQAPIENLKLPELPNWPDAVSFIQYKGLDKMEQKAKEYFALETTLFGQAFLEMNREERRKLVEEMNKPGVFLYDAHEYGMELLQDYYEDRIKELLSKYQKISDSDYKLYGKQIDKVEKTYEDKVNALTELTPNYITLLRSHMHWRCQQLADINHNHFAKWRDTELELNRKLNNLLHEYWIYCEPYLNKAYNETVFERLNNRRKKFVATYYLPLVMKYQITQSVFSIAFATAFADNSGSCDLEIILPTPKEDMEMELGNSGKDSCPFKDGALGFKPGPCGFSIDCKSFGIECGQGLIGGAKWNFKDKELTLSAKVGVNYALGKKRLGVGAELTTGYEVTFNKNNQIINHGQVSTAKVSGGVSALKADGSAGTGVGFEVSGTLSVSAVSGINANLSSQLSAGMFSFSPN